MVIRSVRTAIAAKSDHASTPYAPSHTKTPSQPDSSASIAWVTFSDDKYSPSKQIDVVRDRVYTLLKHQTYGSGTGFRA